MMKVLIVDDNAEVRQIVADYLPETVDEIFECEDGAEALAVYRTHLPDWVLMDWEMKRTDGITAIRQIRSVYPNAHICMVTAFNNPEIRREAFAAGAEGFVVKDDLFELEGILSSPLEV